MLCYLHRFWCKNKFLVEGTANAKKAKYKNTLTKAEHGGPKNCEDGHGL